MILTRLVIYSVQLEEVFINDIFSWKQIIKTEKQMQITTSKITLILCYVFRGVFCFTFHDIQNH